MCIRDSPHAYLRKYGICRICFRELAYKGQIPGEMCIRGSIRNARKFKNYPSTLFENPKSLEKSSVLTGTELFSAPVYGFALCALII